MPPENTPVTPIAPPGGIPAPPTPPTSECYMPALAMAYVPMQKWQQIYDQQMALSRGTLFAELDKPFIGEEVKFK
ncbi:MAG: spore coat associated protein CotJA [Hydrogenoanaerobacterium sp.]